MKESGIVGGLKYEKFTMLNKKWLLDFLKQITKMDDNNR